MLLQYRTMKTVTPDAVRPRIYRRREAARVLGVSESQILKFERQGLLHVINVPGIRAKRLSADEVHELAQRWIEEKVS